MSAQVDHTDRQILQQLKADSRCSITALAHKLGLARATVQTRLERLQRTGVIRRFTIELGGEVGSGAIRAVMLVELQGTLARRVISSLKQKPEISELHSTNGTWDLVAHIDVPSLVDFDRLLREVREIEGVLNSETSLLLTRV